MHHGQSEKKTPDIENKMCKKLSLFSYFLGKINTNNQGIGSVTRVGRFTTIKPFSFRPNTPNDKSIQTSQCYNYQKYNHKHDKCNTLQLKQQLNIGFEPLPFQENCQSHKFGLMSYPEHYILLSTVQHECRKNNHFNVFLIKRIIINYNAF